MRGLTANYKAAIAAATVPISPIVEILYATGAVRAWCGTGTLSWNSQSWLGVGNFGGVSAVQERAGPDAGNVTLTLSGIPSSMVAAALSQTNQGVGVTVWLATFDTSWNVIADPMILFKGISDTHKIMSGGETASIQLSVETRMAQLRRASISRYTDAEQKKLHPGDTGLRYVAAMAERPLYWGAQNQNTVGGYSKTDPFDSVERGGGYGSGGTITAVPNPLE